MKLLSFLLFCVLRFAQILFFLNVSLPADIAQFFKMYKTFTSFISSDLRPAFPFSQKIHGVFSSVSDLGIDFIQSLILKAFIRRQEIKLNTLNFFPKIMIYHLLSSLLFSCSILALTTVTALVSTPCSCKLVVNKLQFCG